MSVKKKAIKKVSRPRAKKSSKQKVQKITKAAAKQSTAKKSKEGLSQQDKEELILEYRANARKLSRSILRRWHARLDLEELDSLVDLALCEAASRYNPEKGASFMTFLYYHLRGTLVRAVDAAANANVVPAADYEIDELASGYETDAGTGAAVDIADALSNHEYQLPDEALYRKELANLSNVACSKLDELEQAVIYRLYVQEEPLVDIARSLGYSRCHISRVKKRALDVLHENLSNSLEMEAVEREDLDGVQKRSLRKSISRRKFAQEDDEVAPYQLIAETKGLVDNQSQAA